MIETLGQEHREVVLHQPAQLSCGGEGLVRHTVTLHPVEQRRQPRLTLRRSRLDIDELRFIARMPILIFQSGDLHVGRDPTVALPVNADEDIALLEVGSIKVARGMRPGAHLEHHRREA